MVARISAQCKKIKYEALDTGEETSDGLKPLINNIKQAVNHWSSEELERIYTKVLWLQQHIVSPGQAWRMFRWTPLEVLGHLKRKKTTACFPKRDQIQDTTSLACYLLSQRRQQEFCWHDRRNLISWVVRLFRWSCKQHNVIWLVR